jgi:hypothetical protein
MNITILTTQASLDPSASVPDSEFPTVLAAYQKELDHEIHRHYPNAEIEHVEEDGNWTLSNYEQDDRDEVHQHLQSIMEAVFETGNFWA